MSCACCPAACLHALVCCSQLLLAPVQLLLCACLDWCIGLCKYGEHAGQCMSHSAADSNSVHADPAAVKPLTMLRLPPQPPTPPEAHRANVEAEAMKVWLLRKPILKWGPGKHILVQGPDTWDGETPMPPLPGCHSMARSCIGAACPCHLTPVCW